MTLTHPPEDAWYSLKRDDGRALARVRAGDAAQAVALVRRRDGIPDREPIHARRLPEAIALWLDARPDANSRPFVTPRAGDSETESRQVDDEELDDLLGGWAEATFHGDRVDLDLTSRDLCGVSGSYRSVRLTWGHPGSATAPDPALPWIEDLVEAAGAAGRAALRASRAGPPRPDADRVAAAAHVAGDLLRREARSLEVSDDRRDP